MQLFVGLGNPGAEYRYNRHNVGFMFADFLLKELNPQTDWKKDAYLLSETAKATPDFILAKPTTFMNKSGEAVRKMMNDWKIDVDNLVVIHDDLDIPLGKFRIVKGYGPKLHNGIESIQNHLHSMDFLRIRIGVDNRAPGNRIPGIDYVLQNFTPEEKKQIEDEFPAILNLLKVEHHITL